MKPYVGTADLHSHSTASDGALKPEELVSRAAARGLTHLALTDHDNASGVAQADNCVFITDRRKAIEYAFEHAAPEDCIVIAGKGHEDYQIFKDRTIHFSDREIAAQLAGVKLDKF